MAATSRHVWFVGKHQTWQLCCPNCPKANNRWRVLAGVQSSECSDFSNEFPLEWLDSWGICGFHFDWALFEVSWNTLKFCAYFSIPKYSGLAVLDFSRHVFGNMIWTFVTRHVMKIGTGRFHHLLSIASLRRTCKWSPESPWVRCYSRNHDSIVEMVDQHPVLAPLCYVQTSAKCETTKNHPTDIMFLCVWFKLRDLKRIFPCLPFFFSCSFSFFHIHGQGQTEWPVAQHPIAWDWRSCCCDRHHLSRPGCARCVWKWGPPSYRHEIRGMMISQWIYLIFQTNIPDDTHFLWMDSWATNKSLAKNPIICDLCSRYSTYHDHIGYVLFIYSNIYYTLSHMG